MSIKTLGFLYYGSLSNNIKAQKTNEDVIHKNAFTVINYTEEGKKKSRGILKNSYCSHEEDIKNI